MPSVKRDFPPYLIPKILNFLDWFEKKVPEYNQLLSGNGVFLERTCGVGVIPPEMAIAWGCTGPVLYCCNKEARFCGPLCILAAALSPV